jgi:hypothetical protein
MNTKETAWIKDFVGMPKSSAGFQLVRNDEAE